MATQRFPIRFTGVNRALSLLGMGPRNSDVAVDDDSVEVRMGWAFRATFPRTAVGAVATDDGRVLGWGVHGWRGVWLVNGSSGGLLRIELDPPQRAKAVFIPVQLRVLRVSVEDPQALLAALT